MSNHTKLTRCQQQKAILPQISSHIGAFMPGSLLKQLSPPHNVHALSIIQGLSFSGDSTQIASASADGTLQLWNLRAKKIVWSIRAHKGMATAVAFSPNGETLASGGQDMTVQLRSSHTGRLLRCLGIRDPAAGLIFVLHGQCLAVGGHESPVDIYNVHTGRLVRSLENSAFESTFATSPDGVLLSAPGKIWNVKTGKVLQILTLPNHGKTIRDSSSINNRISSSLQTDTVTYRTMFLPDRQTLVGVQGDGTCRFWDIHTGRLKKILSYNQLPNFWPNGNSLARMSLAAHLWDKQLDLYSMSKRSKQVFTVAALSTEGSKMAWGRTDGAILLWHFVRGDRKPRKLHQK